MVFFTSIKPPANYLSMKYLDLNFFTYYTVGAKRPKKLVKDALHFFLYIINPKKYCTFQLRALCVRARTMHGLEMHLMFCYNEFWIYLHICHFLKAFRYIESIKSCLLPLLSNLYCTSIKRPLFKVPRVAA